MLWISHCIKNTSPCQESYSPSMHCAHTWLFAWWDIPVFSIFMSRDLRELLWTAYGGILLIWNKNADRLIVDCEHINVKDEFEFEISVIAFFPTYCGIPWLQTCSNVVYRHAPKSRPHSQIWNYKCSLNLPLQIMALIWKTCPQCGHVNDICVCFSPKTLHTLHNLYGKGVLTTEW